MYHSAGISKMDSYNNPMGLSSNSFVQPKLSIGEAGDKYEQEADAVADKVMASNGPTGVDMTSSRGSKVINMKCAKCEEEEKQQSQTGVEGTIQRKSSGWIQMQAKQDDEEEVVQMSPSSQSIGRETMHPSADFAVQLRRSSGNGQSLPEQVNSELSGKMGSDFSGVNIHTDSNAVQMSEEIGAEAFTHSKDIYFNRGKYDPGSSAGKHLLAHELTHVVQQTGGNTANVQRHVLENDPSTAPPMTCTVANSTPAGLSLDVVFGINNSSLSPTDILAISHFVANWHLVPVAEPVRVDGYASIDGTPAINWPLSCARAEILAQELMTPSDGSPGIPAAFITVFAQGETDIFSTSLAPNRRAQAHIPPAPIPPPTITSQTVATAPGSRTRTTIGVGEEVDLTHSSGSVTWARTAGNLSSLTGPTVRFTAPDTAATVIVTGGAETITFTVIEPNDVHRDRRPGTGIRHTLNNPDIGIRSHSFILPDTVNFGNISYHEVDVPCVATGAFSCNNGAGHDASPSTIPVADTVVAGKGSGPNGNDEAYSGSCGGVAPFTPGSLTFRIPYEYQVGTGPFHRFTIEPQVHTLAADASTLTTEKSGASGSTTIASATSTY